MEYYGNNDWRDYHLAHYGVKGMKWRNRKGRVVMGPNGKPLYVYGNPPQSSQVTRSGSNTSSGKPIRRKKKVTSGGTGVHRKEEIKTPKLYSNRKVINKKEARRQRVKKAIERIMNNAKKKKNQTADKIRNQLIYMNYKRTEGRKVKRTNLKRAARRLKRYRRITGDQSPVSTWFN